MNLKEIVSIYHDGIAGECVTHLLRDWAIKHLCDDINIENESVVLLSTEYDSDQAVCLAEKIIVEFGMKNEIDLDREKIIRDIQLSFLKSGQPEWVTLYQGKGHLNDYDGEGALVEEFFERKTWDQVDLVGGGGFLIRYLRNDALLYFLPSILVAIMKDYDPQTDLVDSFFGFFVDDIKKIKFVVGSLNICQLRLFLLAIIMAQYHLKRYLYEFRVARDMIKSRISYLERK